MRGSHEFTSQKLQVIGAVGILLTLKAESRVKHATRLTILTQQMIWKPIEPAPHQSIELFIQIGGANQSKIREKR